MYVIIGMMSLRVRVCVSAVGKREFALDKPRMQGAKELHLLESRSHKTYTTLCHPAVPRVPARSHPNARAYQYCCVLLQDAHQVTCFEKVEPVILSPVLQ